MTFQSKRLDHLIRTQMRKRNTPGMAISVLKDGQPIYAKGFGLRNLKQFQSIDADTIMGIGSISKSFTAFAVMKLQEMGKLSINDSVADYLLVEPFLSRPEITLKHLLSHSSGIPSMDAGMLGFTYTFDDFSSVYPATSREDFLAHIADASDYLIFRPGEKFFYNNDMYSCLCFIIEQLTGMSFIAFVQQEILNPLNMTRAVFTQQGLDEDPENNVMTGYRFQAENKKRVARESDLPIGGYFPPRGGLYVSMNEMLHYAQCLMNGGEYNGVQLLSPESVAALFDGIISAPYGEGEDPKYALGWSVESPTEAIPYTVIQHSGGMGTSSSFLIMVPELKLAVVTAENSSTGLIPVVVRAAIALAMEQDPEVVVEDLRLAKLVDEIKGMYQSAYGIYNMKVEVKAGILQADIEVDDGSVSLPLIPENLNALEFTTYSLRSKNKSRVQFYRNEETKNVEYVSYDRYLYRRV